MLSGAEMVRFSWPTLWAFLRVSTNAKVFEQPLSIDEAVAIVSSWLECPNAGIVEPGERHWQILQHLMKEAQCSGPLVTDAVLAAVAVEHGGTIYTTDRDFSRFTGLAWTNPLEQA
jgi:toxin-antitoxin system PIN domain toxin